MKVFIWFNIDQLTDNHHSDGGLVVIADNEQDARIIAMERGVVFSDDEKPEVYKLDDEHLGSKNKIFIFPNAGCC
jgi:hypothetical protein